MANHMLEASLVVTVGSTFAAMALWRFFKALDEHRQVSSLASKLPRLVCHGRPFAPVQPSHADLQVGQTSDGPLLRVGPMMLQRAQFNALWIRIGCLGQRIPHQALLRATIKLALEAQASFTFKAAVYVAVSERCLERGDKVELEWLKGQGFSFHHYRWAPTGAEAELVYVADLAKMVPAYATSIEGAASIILSRDGHNLLAVWEHGCWSMPGGAVDEGEMKITALKRECREEVGITLDDAFTPVYLGGYQRRRARDGKINDNFSAFAVRAACDNYTVDQKEIDIAMWLPWQELVDAWEAEGKPTHAKNIPLAVAALPNERKMVSRNLLTWLDTYRSGRGLVCDITDNEVRFGTVGRHGQAGESERSNPTMY